MAKIRINVYRDGGAWYGARWVDGEYDGCDALPVPPDASETEAMEAAREMPLIVEGERDIRRVDDVRA